MGQWQAPPETSSHFQLSAQRHISRERPSHVTAGSSKSKTQTADTAGEPASSHMWKGKDQETEKSDDDAQNGTSHLSEWEPAVPDIPTGDAARRCPINQDNDLIWWFLTARWNEDTDAKLVSIFVSTRDKRIIQRLFETCAYWLAQSCHVAFHWLQLNYTHRYTCSFYISLPAAQLVTVSCVFTELSVKNEGKYQ